MAKKNNKKKWSESEMQDFDVVSEYLNVASLYEDADNLDEDRLTIRFKLTVRNIVLVFLAFFLGVMSIGIYQTRAFGISPDGEYRLVTSEVRDNVNFMSEREEYAKILFKIADEMELYMQSPSITSLSKTRTQRQLLYDEWLTAITNLENGLTIDGTQRLTEPNSNQARELDASLKTLLVGLDSQFFQENQSLRAVLTLELQVPDGSNERSPNGLLPITNDFIQTIEQERSTIRRILEGGA